MTGDLYATGLTVRFGGRTVLDGVDRMDTGFELSAQELHDKEEHRRYYDGYLQQTRE